jgi:hypothetical protein
MARFIQAASVIFLSVQHTNNGIYGVVDRIAQ